MKLPRAIRRIGKHIVKATPILRRHILSSTDYRVLGGAEEASAVAASSSGWLTSRTAGRQDRAYEELIAAMKRGEPRLDFEIAAEAIAATGLKSPRLLDVGCGSGYYADVFAALLPDGVQYTGIDYSDAMIARARARSPLITFEVGDATRLSYADGTFDVVFNGVSLMHVIDYRAVIAEAARVAAHHCIFHTVPVFDDCQTTFLRKYAYGSAVIEVIFSKPELIRLCQAAGLHLEKEWNSIPYDVFEATGHHSSAQTYLFSKRAN